MKLLRCEIFRGKIRMYSLMLFANRILNNRSFLSFLSWKSIYKCGDLDLSVKVLELAIEIRDEQGDQMSISAKLVRYRTPDETIPDGFQ